MNKARTDNRWFDASASVILRRTGVLKRKFCFYLAGKAGLDTKAEVLIFLSKLKTQNSAS